MTRTQTKAAVQSWLERSDTVNCDTVNARQSVPVSSKLVSRVRNQWTKINNMMKFTLGRVRGIESTEGQGSVIATLDEAGSQFGHPLSRQTRRASPAASMGLIALALEQIEAEENDSIVWTEPGAYISDDGRTPVPSFLSYPSGSVNWGHSPAPSVTWDFVTRRPGMPLTPAGPPSPPANTEIVTPEMDDQEFPARSALIFESPSPDHLRAYRRHVRQGSDEDENADAGKSDGWRGLLWPKAKKSRSHDPFFEAFGIYRDGVASGVPKVATAIDVHQSKSVSRLKRIKRTLRSLSIGSSSKSVDVFGPSRP